MTKFATHSGKIVDILNPDPTTIDPLDIVTSLSHVARYAGHTETPYSVGQHTIAIMIYMDVKHPEMLKTIRQAALMHDFPEYVLQDMIRPLKEALRAETSWYDDLTERWENAICTRFNFGTGEVYRAFFEQHVKSIDQMAYHAEVFVLGLEGHAVPVPDDIMIFAVNYAYNLDIEGVRTTLHEMIVDEFELEPRVRTNVTVNDGG